MEFCDWLVIPSRIESIPLIFGDAVQKHLPILSTGVGDMGELTKQLGVGLSVPAADRISLADGIRKAIQLHREDYDGAWQEAAKLFDIHQSALRCEAELQKAVNAR
jgi:glycosyltransferase involved in cell wall biosynthesis